MPRTARRPMGFSPCSGVGPQRLLSMSPQPWFTWGPDLAVFIAHRPLRRSDWRFDCAGSADRVAGAGERHPRAGTRGEHNWARLFGPGGCDGPPGRRPPPSRLFSQVRPATPLETLPTTDWLQAGAAPQMKLR